MLRMGNKKVWLFLLLLCLTMATVYYWCMAKQGKRAYANGRMVEVEEDGCACLCESPQKCTGNEQKDLSA